MPPPPKKKKKLLKFHYWFHSHQYSGFSRISSCYKTSDTLHNPSKLCVKKLLKIPLDLWSVVCIMFCVSWRALLQGCLLRDWPSSGRPHGSLVSNAPHTPPCPPKLFKFNPHIVLNISWKFHSCVKIPSDRNIESSFGSFISLYNHVCVSTGARGRRRQHRGELTGGRRHPG